MLNSETWHTLEVGGHPCHVCEPAQRHPLGLVAIYLHGGHQQRLSELPEYTQTFLRRGVVLVEPHTGPTWWTDRLSAAFDARLTPERHLLDNVLPLIADRWDVRPPRIGIFGTSMGGQGALRFAYKHPRLFPVVAAVSPAIDYQQRYDAYPVLQEMYDDPEAVRQDTALLHVHPLNWPPHQFFCCDPADRDWWESSDRLRMKLGSLGIPFECDLETTGGGHGAEYYGRMADRVTRFLVQRLEQQQRQIPLA